ncbi:hypothetical protein LTR95_011089 [Oleoguttula sp. CCFEE 5521]
MATTKIKQDRIILQHKTLLKSIADGHKALLDGVEPIKDTTKNPNAPKNVIAKEICTLQYKIGQQMDMAEHTGLVKLTLRNVQATSTSGYKTVLSELLEGAAKKAAVLHPDIIRPSTTTEPEMTVARMTELMQTPGFFQGTAAHRPHRPFRHDERRQRLEVADEVPKAMASVFEPAVLRRMATALRSVADSAESGPEQEVLSSRPVKSARVEEAKSAPVEVRLLVSVDTAGGAVAVRARPSTLQR